MQAEPAKQREERLRGDHGQTGCGSSGGGGVGANFKATAKNMGLCQYNICTIIYILKIVINYTVGLWFTLNEKK